MTFEQPASLNRFIEPSVPHSWGFRWQLFKMFLPGIVFFAIIFLQGILLKEWIHDHWAVSPFLKILADFLILLILMVFGVEMNLWAVQKHKRIIGLQENFVRIGSGLAQRINWQRVVAWRFNNLTNEENYRVVEMEYNVAINRKKLRRHVMALQKPQVEQLISELKLRQQKEGFAYSILDEKTDFAAKTFKLKPTRKATLYLYLAGSFLFIEGTLTLLLASESKDNSQGSEFAPGPNGSFATFARSIATHFSSATEFRHFLLAAGVILCAIGLSLIIWSVMLDKKAKAR